LLGQGDGSSSLCAALTSIIQPAAASTRVGDTIDCNVLRLRNRSISVSRTTKESTLTKLHQKKQVMGKWCKNDSRPNQKHFILKKSGNLLAAVPNALKSRVITHFRFVANRVTLMKYDLRKNMYERAKNVPEQISGFKA
jgi:hypothetical protein